MTTVDDFVRAMVARRGPVGFDAVVEAALYDSAGGFYMTAGRAGRTGDFITSPEVGALFGLLVARALDAWWTEAGEPAVFTVVEAGAGPGTLAHAILRANPSCAGSLRYVLVERSEAQRGLQAARLALEDPAAVLVPLEDPEDPRSRRVGPGGPAVVSLAALPRLAPPCVVLANELLDNLPFRLAERRNGAWLEVRVGVDGPDLVEVLVPLSSRDALRLERLAPSALDGARAPIVDAAAGWVRSARQLAGAEGRVVAIDYACDTTDELASRPAAEWLRTYRLHERGGVPLALLGSQDITVEVPVDQLGARPTSSTRQAEWLRQLGLDDVVAKARRQWRERAGVGDLDAVRARSQVSEAAALTDPAGLGAFRVLEWSPRSGRQARA
ncbi:MAG: SAM-dependent methyltransferase [Microthrixaceae bacterium]